MGFTEKQVQALRRCLSSRHIRTREANGRELSYIEGWYAISEANRIFGFDGWNRETVETRCVLARENRGSFLAVYVAKVRITVLAEGATIVREGHGSGEGRGNSPGEVHDICSQGGRNRCHQTGPGDFRQTVRIGALSQGQEEPIVARSGDTPAGRRKSTHSAPSGLTPRRYDTDPAAIALLRAATSELDD